MNEGRKNKDSWTGGEKGIWLLGRSKIENKTKTMSEKQVSLAGNVTDILNN